MNTTLKKKDDGFTIIEVVLVLAIAGLIFLIVFLALPALQRSRRDTQRKNDAGRLLSAMETWAGNNSGEYPGSGDLDELRDDYLTVDGSQFADPREGDYDLSWGTGDPDVGAMTVGQGTCDGGGGDRDRVVRVGVEEGSVYCQDNR